MKKSTMALAAVAAAVLGTSALGLAACGDDDKPSGSNEYTITFDANGGGFSAGTTTPVTKKTVGGKLIAFPADPTIAPSGTDYTFKGWALNSNATADDAISLPKTFGSDETLYAIWGGEVTSTGAYLITFDPNGGSITSGQSSMMTVDGKLTSTLPTASYGTRKFLGWYKVKNSTNAADKVTVNSTTFDSATVVHASWGEEEQPVTEKWVTFNANGGKFEIDGEEETVTSIETSGGVISELPTPVRDGWEFKGFYKSPSSKADPFTETTQVTEKNLTVYAHWKEINAAHTGKVTVDGVDYDLTDNTSALGTWDPTADDDKDAELMITSFKPGKDKELSFTIDGKTVEFYLYEAKGLRGVEGAKNSSVTTLTDGTYAIYLKHYPVNLQHKPDARPEENWSLTASYTGATEEEREDGIYAGNKRLDRVIYEENDNQLKAEHIRLNKDDIVTFLYQGEEITVAGMEAGATNSKRVMAEDGKLKVLEPGTFTFYLKLDSYEVWVTDEADEVENELQSGDGIISDGTLLKAFETFTGGHNEIRALDVEITSDVDIEIKYGGNIITDWTLKPDSNVPQDALSDNKLSLDAGTYKFYYRYDTKVMYVEKEGVVIVVTPTTPLTNMTVNDTSVTLTFNDKADMSGDMDTEYSAKNVTLMKDDVVKLYNDETGVTFWLDGFDGGATKKALSVANSSVLSAEATVLKSGKYDLYIKHYASGWVISVQLKEAIGGDEEEEADAVAVIGSKTEDAVVSTQTPTESNGYQDAEISLTNVQIAADTAVSFKYKDEVISFTWYLGNSPAISSTVAGATTSVKTLATGKYSFYLKHYTADSGSERWELVAQLDVRQTGLTPATALTANDWYLTGDMTGFGNLYNEYKLTKNSDQYEIEVELPAYTTLKLVNGNKTTWLDCWAVGDELSEHLFAGGNLAVLQAGKYGFYYNPTQSKIYVARITEGGGGGGGEQETDKTPGLYVGETKLQAWGSHNDSEVKLEKVKIAANSTLTFVYGGKIVVPEIKESDGSPCTDKIVLKDGALYCANGGVFDMYYEHGANKIWIEYKGQYVAPSADLGGLAINGTIAHAFILNDGGFNEVYTGDTYTVLAAQTEFTIMYDGANVTSQVTLKKDSKGKIEGGKLIVPAGSFKFYYDYAAKELYIGGTIDVSQSDPNESLTYESTQTATGKTQAYITGKLNGKSASFDWQNGYLMTYNAAGNYGNGEYTITIYLKAGDEVKVRCKDSDDKGGYAFIDSGSPAYSHVERGTTNDNAIVINDSGYYTFYYKANYGTGGLWLVYEEA